MILYAPDDWRGALQAASLLRPLNTVLLPATDAARAEIERLKPKGSAALGGAQVLWMNNAAAPAASGASRQITGDQVAALLNQAGAAPRHAVVVDGQDPAMALLAAPWAAYSGVGCVRRGPGPENLCVQRLEVRQSPHPERGTSCGQRDSIAIGLQICGTGQSLKLCSYDRRGDANRRVLRARGVDQDSLARRFAQEG